MIKLYDNIPTVYAKASRDFQYLGWLFDVVLNDVKHNIDGIYKLPNAKDNARLAELLVATLGFKIRRTYSPPQLLALVSILPTILRCKGSMLAITILGEALLRAEGIIGRLEVSKDEASHTIKILLPKELTDSTLLLDVLPYIMPAGLTYKIIRKTEMASAESIKIATIDTMRVGIRMDRDLARIFNQDTEHKYGHYPELSNFLYDDFKTDQNYYSHSAPMNTGVVGNMLIPSFDQDYFDGSDAILKPGEEPATITEESEQD